MHHVIFLTRPPWEINSNLFPYFFLSIILTAGTANILIARICFTTSTMNNLQQKQIDYEVQNNLRN